jgi:hypothetical protein
MHTGGMILVADVTAMPQEMLSQAYGSSLVYQFDIKGFPGGHGPTDYLRWFTAKEDYSIAYQAE